MVTPQRSQFPFPHLIGSKRGGGILNLSFYYRNHDLSRVFSKISGNEAVSGGQQAGVTSAIFDLGGVGLRKGYLGKWVRERQGVQNDVKKSLLYCIYVQGFACKKKELNFYFRYLCREYIFKQNKCTKNNKYFMKGVKLKS